MAIRPVDLQGAIFQATQTAGITKQAEDNPRASQIAAQNQFINDVEKRDESVHETDRLEGNRINPEGERQTGGGAQYRRRERKAGQALPEDVVELAEFSDGEHIIDFTA